jgi:hypothetical protein
MCLLARGELSPLTARRRRLAAPAGDLPYPSLGFFRRHRYTGVAIRIGETAFFGDHLAGVRKVRGVEGNGYGCS